MSTSFLRRALCSMAVLTLLLTPCAAKASPAAPPPGASAEANALAPIEDALNRLGDAMRGGIRQWLAEFFPESPETHEKARLLIPGGQSIGVAMMCEGVLVVGTGDPGTAQSPARLAGIRSGDRITHVNGQPVVGSEAFSHMVAGGEEVSLTVCRDDDRRTVTLRPVLDQSDSEWRIGAWVRDSTAGVGTMTFIDPETGVFGALGHPIQDADTSAMLPVAEGLLYDSDIVAIQPGKAGVPGELVGKFMDETRQIGEVRRNTACGIFGQYAADYDKAAALPIAAAEEVLPGAVQILTTLDDGAPQAYDAEIVRLYDGGAANRSMLLQVTDPDLLEKTGGIVQGMSGSPIIQDGKLVGAVTHVLVNDPTRGYGIFIENMLEAAG